MQIPKTTRNRMVPSGKSRIGESGVISHYHYDWAKWGTYLSDGEIEIESMLRSI